MKNSKKPIGIEPMRSIPTPTKYPMVSLVVVMVALYGLTTPNPLESLWTCCLMLVLLRWFWWSRQPGILLFCLLMPFLEIHTSLLEANQSGVTMDELFYGTGGKTLWMSSMGLFAVAIGVRATWRLFNQDRIVFSIEKLKQASDQIHQNKLVIAFFLATFLSQLIDQIIPYSSGFRQLETYVSGISEAMLFVIAAKFMMDRKHLWMIILIFSYLITVSFYSFFSSWKDPLIVLMVTSLIRVSNFNVRQMLRLTPIIAPALLFLLVWQSVKGEYRQFLNGGRYSQRIVVNQEEALSKFQDLAKNALLSNEIISEDRLDATYRRIGYLEYFSNAVKNVPTEIPHEQGNLLLSNLEFALIPRFLAPNKGIKNDKAKVEKYTDFYFGAYGGSSFSLGHYCEAYIDWGTKGMLIQLFAFGLIGGCLYILTLIRTKTLNPLLSLSITWICMKPWATFQADMITMTGQLIWGAVSHLLIFFPLYKFMNIWIQNRKHEKSKLYHHPSTQTITNNPSQGSNNTFPFLDPVKSLPSIITHRE